MYVHHVCAGCLLRPQEAIMSPGTGELSVSHCGCWELNHGPLQKTASALNH